MHQDAAENAAPARTTPAANIVPSIPLPLRRPGDAAAKPPNVQSRLGSCQTGAGRVWFVPPVPSAPPPLASSYENTFLLVLVNTLKRGFYASSELAQPNAVYRSMAYSRAFTTTLAVSRL